MPNTVNYKNKGGAPRRNRNRLRHGLRAAQLPREARYIELAINTFRRQLEDTLTDAYGETTIYQAALINSACRHERRAMLAERWFRLSNGELSLADKLQLHKTISDASDARDKCLERLQLNVNESDPWEGLSAPGIAHNGADSSEDQRDGEHSGRGDPQAEPNGQQAAGRDECNPDESQAAHTHKEAEGVAHAPPASTTEAPAGSAWGLPACPPAGIADAPAGPSCERTKDFRYVAVNDGT